MTLLIPHYWCIASLTSEYYTVGTTMKARVLLFFMWPSHLYLHNLRWYISIFMATTPGNFPITSLGMKPLLLLLLLMFKLAWWNPNNHGTLQHLYKPLWSLLLFLLFFSSQQPLGEMMACVWHTPTFYIAVGNHHWQNCIHKFIFTASFTPGLLTCSLMSHSN